MKAIDCFKGEYFFLSNFYESYTTINHIVYPTIEHFFQSQKAMRIEERKAIIEANSPNIAKAIGRKVQLRPDWEEIKVQVMYDGVKAKFSKNPILKAKLLAIGDAELIEGNWWNDTYWGICKGVGKNKLGKILMRVRDELNKENITVKI